MHGINILLRILDFHISRAILKGKLPLYGLLSNYNIPSFPLHDFMKGNSYHHYIYKDTSLFLLGFISSLFGPIITYSVMWTQHHYFEGIFHTSHQYWFGTTLETTLENFSFCMQVKVYSCEGHVLQLCHKGNSLELYIFISRLLL